jgi:hypothetical protein
MANETPELPLTEELMTGLPKAPKGYVGPEKLAPVIKEIQAKKATAEEELAQSDIRLEKAKREEKATEAELRKSFYEQEKVKEEAMPQRAALKQAREEISSAKFEPTKDTVKDIAGLFSLMGVVGMVVGKKNAMQGMYAMNGMMEGHIKGRNDLVKQQAVEFDKNFKVLQAKVESAKQELEEAMRLRMYDQRAGEEAIAIAVARSESPFIKESVARVGVQKTINTLNDTLKTVETMVKLQNDLQGKADERAARVAKATAAKAGIGDKYGFGDIVATNLNEAVGTISNIVNLPYDVTSGVFQGRNTTNLLFAPLGALTNELTSEDVQRYNKEIKNFGKFASRVVSGGRVVPAGVQKDFEDQFVIREGDSPLTVLTSLAQMRQVMERAAEVKIKSASTDPGLKQLYVDGLEVVRSSIPFTVNDINRFANQRDKNKTFSDMFTEYGLGGQQQTPATTGKPTPTEADRERGRSNPTSRANFITHFGVEP